MLPNPQQYIGMTETQLGAFIALCSLCALNCLFGFITSASKGLLACKVYLWGTTLTSVLVLGIMSWTLYEVYEFVNNVESEQQWYSHLSINIRSAVISQVGCSQPSSQTSTPLSASCLTAVSSTAYTTFVHLIIESGILFGLQIVSLVSSVTLLVTREKNENFVNIANMKAAPFS